MPTRLLAALVVSTLSLGPLLFPAATHAQSATGTILGSIQDTTDGVLVGAAVVVVNTGTGVQRELFTDALGYYEAPLLPPGQYQVRAALSGFRTAVRQGIRLQVNQRAVVDFILEVGDVAEQVVVTADASPLQIQNATVGTVVDNTKITELPLNGRDFFQLATIVSGAVPPAQGSQNSTQGGAISINGVREQSNNFLLDGIDNNNLTINQMVFPLSMDAVEEFKIQSTTYSAEFGRSAGGQFNVVTKSGANQFSGSLFEFFRHRTLDARNFFDDLDQPEPHFQRDQAGGSLGGPLRQNRTFFFANYEGTRIRRAFTRLATVPPTAWINGDFSSLLTGVIDPATGLDTGQLIDPRTGLPVPGNRIPLALQDPAGRVIAGYYPAPDDPNAMGPSTATVSPAGRSDVHNFTIKVDENLGPGHQLFGRYSLWDEDRVNPFDPLVDPTNVPGFGSLTRNRGQSLAIGWTKTIGSRAINDFRFGFNRLRAGIFQESLGRDVAGELGIQGLLTDPLAVGRPGVILGITDALLEPTNTPQERRDNTFQLTNNFSWQRGRHSFKAGGDLRHFQDDFRLDIIARGLFIFAGLSGNPVADLLMGTPVVALRQNPETTSARRWRTTSYNAYVQDDWRVFDDLTLNLGMRYEFNQPPRETQDLASIPDLGNPDGGFLEVGRNGIPRAGFSADKNNFAPRIGAAWQPGGSTSTVIRSGYGIYYDASILNHANGQGMNPPFFNLDIAPGPGPLRDFFRAGIEPLPFVIGVDPDHTRDAYYHQWSVDVQREVWPDLVLDVGYYGSTGRNLLRRIDLNQGLPGGPPFFNPNFGPMEIGSASASSDYHSVQVGVERRFRNGLMVHSSYTWSRSRDDSSALFGSDALAGGGAPQNSSDPGADRGPSDFDTPHRYVLSWVWELPFGPGERFLDSSNALSTLFGNWAFAGIAAFQSGRPFSVYYSGDNFSGTNNGPNGGVGLDRPNLIGDPTLANPRPDRWFNVDAFEPPNNAFGNAGRNILRGDGLNNVDLALYRGLQQNLWVVSDSGS